MIFGPINTFEKKEQKTKHKQNEEEGVRKKRRRKTCLQVVRAMSVISVMIAFLYVSTGTGSKNEYPARLTHTGPGHL